MDQERQRIQDDLRGLLLGDVRCDDFFVQMYASDASIYEIRPLGVVRPRNTTDVLALVRYAAEQQLPLHARGSGTGLVGGCLGPGLIVDFSHSMRRILDLSNGHVRVQSGAVLANLNRYLSRENRFFGPDSSTAEVTTIGGLLAMNRSGSHWMRYGSARDHVVSLQVVLANGDVVELNEHTVSVSNADADAAPRLDRIIRQTSTLLTRNQEAIKENMPRTLVNSSGYHVYDILGNDSLNLARLMAGSEGTLGLITEATLKTDVRPKHHGVCLLMFDRLENAAQAAREVRRQGFAACDLVDRRLLSLARKSDSRYQSLLPAEAEAVLLAEYQSDDLAEVRDNVKALANFMCRRKKWAFDSHTALEASDIELYWRITREMIQTLYRLEGNQRPVPFIEDIAVPLESLPDFVVAAQNVLKKHHVTASLFAHAGHGQLHIRPFLDLSHDDDVQRMQRVADEMVDQVIEYDGTLSGEHGDGLVRSVYLRKRYGSLYPVFREIKRFFDPESLFNPGKVADATAQSITRNLRPVHMPRPSGSSAGQEDAAPQQVIQLQLNWNDAGILHAARQCNGCGTCRTQSPDSRMCPIFRFAPSEEASPRSKANLLRGLLTRQVGETDLGDEELRRIADLCVNCHQCRLECPAEVDIPGLMFEYKAQHVLTAGMSMADSWLVRLDRLAALAASVPLLSNFIIRNRRSRWFLEKALGISQYRKLPKVDRRSFLSRAARRKLTRPSVGSGDKVVYFTDVYANYFDTQLAESLVAVYKHNGVDVYVQPNQRESGIALIAEGAVEHAKEVAAKNIKLLAEAVRQGYHIVTTEPSAALCLTHEYLRLFDDDDARLVAENTSDACLYLWRAHQQGRLELDLRPVNMTVGYHLPCHLKALNVGSPGESLLRVIPGLSVRRIEEGCSGMAGLFGLKRKNFRNSLRAGWPLISAMREPAVHIGCTECSACKMQMEQGTTKPTIHPLKLLAHAYGLMPEVAKLLRARSGELTVT